MSVSVLQKIIEAKSEGRKLLAVLVDPDAARIGQLDALLATIGRVPVDFIFLGGSLLMDDAVDDCIRRIKARSTVQVVLFPGGGRQVHAGADAILLLSLISGRNPEYLIGAHVRAAPSLKASGLEIIPTGYILIEGGNTSSVAYITQTIPIPSDKPDIAVCTALAGTLLGLQLIYLEAGSGAPMPVPVALIRQVATAIEVPVIVGGGIRSTETARQAFAAGADMIVVGTAFEENPFLLEQIAAAATLWQADR